MILSLICDSRLLLLLEAVVGFCFLLLVVWRIWRFVISPRLHPREPRELPYWIPYVGHLIPYFRDSFRTLTNARMYFNDNREPFSITVAGQVMYIVTGPADVTAAYRNTATLSMDAFLQDLMRGFEITPDGTRRVYEEQYTTNEVKIVSNNPTGKSLAHLMVDWFRIQLSPGDNLTKLGEVTCEYFEKALRWENMTAPEYLLSSSEHHKDISLLHFCETVLLRAAVRSFFGDILTEISPSLHKDFLAFDDVSWKVLYQYPKWLSKDMLDAKNKIADALEKYFELPQGLRPGANWFIRHQETEMKALGISSRDMAYMIGLIYWVINTNAYKLLFWMMSFLLRDKYLIYNVRMELQACFNADGTLNLPSLQNQSSTYLNALFLESMRMSNSSASARFITADTHIGRYTLKAGRRLLIPYRQLHLNTSVFGENAHEFDINRFLDDPKLAKNPSYRPFGGGKTYCPGRFFAKQELFQILAFLLTRYDVEIAPGQNKFPRMDELKPGIGIVAPVAGDDLVVRVTRRKT